MIAALLAPAVRSSAETDPVDPKIVLAAGVGALAAGAVPSAIDEDDTGAAFTYRDTAPLGIALGSVGLAVLGFGIWLWGRGSEPDSTPTISATRSGAFLGWAGSF